MEQWWLWLGLAVAAAIIAVVAVTVVRSRAGSAGQTALPDSDTAPEVVPTAATDEAEPEAELATKPVEVEEPEPTSGRMVRLRERLSRSKNSLGKGLLTLLSSDKLSDDEWEEIEDILLAADVGITDTTEIVDNLRERVKVLGSRTSREVRRLLCEELAAAIGPDLNRDLQTSPSDGPATVMVVGVNGSGKTTTCGKIARVLIADGNSVVLGAADTFRAAAADQLETWGSRVGAPVVRSNEGADPASVAFDAVKTAKETSADVVLVDTAGRLQNKVGLMDELGKVKRVVEKHGPVAETLLVLDATTGQNGLQQAKVFTEVCDVTGVVLTKLDGTAKGGIIIAVQRQLGVPVKLIGLGEGPDDLAPFDVDAFVDALVSTDD